MQLHDHHYRNLFRHPAMVRALFEGIIVEPWVAALNLDSLRPLPTHYLSDKHRRREADMVWRVRWLTPPEGGTGVSNARLVRQAAGPGMAQAGQEAYLVLMLEHQTRDDHIMAIRCLSYQTLAWQDMYSRKMVPRRGRFPVVLPIVLYTGERPWLASTHIGDLLQPAPPGLRQYQPQYRYLLLDEGELVRAGALPHRNLASLLFQLEHSPDIAQTQGLLHTLQDMLSTPQADELRRAFGAWVRHVLMPRAAPKDAKLPNTTEFSEVIDMLTTGYKNWSRQWWLEGLEQGREEGREEGAAALLLRLLERKFGPLDAQIKARVEQASLADREAWSLNLLDARSLDEVFAVEKP